MLQAKSRARELGEKAVFLAFAAFSSACGTMPAVVYKPNSAMDNPPRRQLRVVVAPFEDLNPGWYGGHSNWYYKPWYPTGPLNSEDYWADRAESLLAPPAPTQVTRYESSLGQDLQASGLFTSVEFKEWPTLAESHSDCDLIITGRYLDDQLHETSIFNWMPLLIPLLKPLGVPIASSDRNLTFEIQALDPLNPAEPLWAQTFKIHDDSSGLVGAYYGTGVTHDVRPATAELWRKAFLQVREQLAQALGPDGALQQRLPAKSRQSGQVVK